MFHVKHTHITDTDASVSCRIIAYVLNFLWHNWSVLIRQLLKAGNFS